MGDVQSTQISYVQPYQPTQYETEEAYLEATPNDLEKLWLEAIETESRNDKTFTPIYGEPIQYIGFDTLTPATGFYDGPFEGSPVEGLPDENEQIKLNNIRLIQMNFRNQNYLPRDFEAQFIKIEEQYVGLGIATYDVINQYWTDPKYSSLLTVERRRRSDEIILEALGGADPAPTFAKLNSLVTLLRRLTQLRSDWQYWVTSDLLNRLIQLEIKSRDLGTWIEREVLDLYMAPEYSGLTDTERYQRSNAIIDRAFTLDPKAVIQGHVQIITDRWKYNPGWAPAYIRDALIALEQKRLGWGLASYNVVNVYYDQGRTNTSATQKEKIINEVIAEANEGQFPYDTWSRIRDDPGLLDRLLVLRKTWNPAVPKDLLGQIIILATVKGQVASFAAIDIVTGFYVAKNFSDLSNDWKHQAAELAIQYTYEDKSPWMLQIELLDELGRTGKPRDFWTSITNDFAWGIKTGLTWAEQEALELSKDIAAAVEEELEQDAEEALEDAGDVIDDVAKDAEPVIEDIAKDAGDIIDDILDDVTKDLGFDTSNLWKYALLGVAGIVAFKLAESYIDKK